MSFQSMCAGAVAVSIGAAASATTLSYPGFSDTTGLTLSGASSVVDNGIDGDVVRLASEDANAGSFFASGLVSINTFQAEFSFRITDVGGISDLSGQVGADGLAFVVQNEGVDALGGSGSGIGYSGIRPSLVIEFDTFFNSPTDPDSNHIGIVVSDGGPLTTVETASVTEQFDNGELWNARVTYDGTTLTVFAAPDGNDLLTPVVTVDDLELLTILGSNSAFVGFTASTAGAFGNHDIVSFSYVPTPGAAVGLAFGAAAICTRRRRSE
ncbi:MAG: L-type lectin-domain containing protein [Planctomycetota bacterium]